MSLPLLKNNLLEKKSGQLMKGIFKVLIRNEEFRYTTGESSFFRHVGLSCRVIGPFLLNKSEGTCSFW